ncbi:MAG: cyclic pyranopterin monophosphate synthase MoaC [Acidobacteria bacterium]|nr:MAG: cyclic pyranopterin monophosphate synthase MoaC [Acidobacteriota bacterium]
MTRASRKYRARLSHIDPESGKIRMVDVSAKPETAREAVARGHIAIAAGALRQIRAGALKKGDPLQTARLAGIMAAKQTSALIPLCHPLPISHVDVQVRPARGGYDIEARVQTRAATGVEMEALTAVAVTALERSGSPRSAAARAVITARDEASERAARASHASVPRPGSGRGV